MKVKNLTLEEWIAAIIDGYAGKQSGNTVHIYGIKNKTILERYVNYEKISEIYIKDFKAQRNSSYYEYWLVDSHGEQLQESKTIEEIIANI